MDSQENLPQSGGAAVGTSGSVPSPLPPSNDLGTEQDHAGTGLPTLDPYEPLAPEEPQPSSGTTVEATNSKSNAN